MANGDLIKLGTFYKAGVKQLLPTNPVSGGNITGFAINQTLEIRDTDSNDAYKLNWREVIVDSMKILIADRNILHSVSWNDLNAQGLVAGKIIPIDGQYYKLRLLTGGANYRTGTDSYSGGSPTANEWDQIITNEANHAGLPKPTAAELTNNVANKTGVHNLIWNWFNMYSLVQEIYAGQSARRVCRGHTSARYWKEDTASIRYTYLGWRPVLEVLWSPPNLSPTINGANKNYEDGFAKVDGVWRQIDEIHAKINGVWRKSE